MSSPQSADDGPRSSPPNDPVAIRAQLQRLLAHPLFSHSKRYPVLLAYTVEQTLMGYGEELKERTIGFEAFGREPDYDVNLDPVVRTSAAEVRKRLIQYYYDPVHAGELLIELSVGSYIPTFRLPSVLRSDIGKAGSSNEDGSDSTTGGLVSTADEGTPSHNTASVPGSYLIKHHWILLASLLFAGAIGFAVGRYHPAPPPSDIDRFWEPISSSASPTTYCLGEPAKMLGAQNVHPSNEAMEGNSARLQSSGRMNVLDVVTLVRTIPALVLRRGTFRVIPSSEASFGQLREGPVVLIGAMDNIWTLRIAQTLRFGFESKDGVVKIVDHKSLKESPWAIQDNIPSQKLTRDYALIARIRDTTTGQPVIIVAGLSDQGTEAASESVYNPVYLDTLLAKAPKNWDRLNMEAVIATHVIDGHPGPPEVMALETW